MKNELIIDGVVENIIFQNEDNGYAVFALDTKDEDIICTGYVQKLNAGETIKAVGSFIVHPSYGKQFNISTFEKTLPTTVNAIEKYLASGLVKGIGKTYAKKIVDKFGEDTLRIIETDPKKLATIKGITYKKAVTISQVFSEQTELRNVMIFLQGYGVTPLLSMKIYKKFKNKTMEVVAENPYKLADEIFGVGFKTADTIADKIGIDRESIFRIKAGIKFVLTQATNNGHVYLPKQQLILETANLLEIKDDLIESSILELQFESAIQIKQIEDTTVIYLNYYYYAESYSAKRLVELVSTGIDRTRTTKKHIEELELQNHIKLADNQIEAVIAAVHSGVLVITGGPGTGKTTTINIIIGILEKEGYEIVLAAPTGKAAKRMTETTGKDAKTIHRLLGTSYVPDSGARQRFDKNEDDPIEADVIIIDESSMVDIALLHSLLRATADGTRLIFVGDVDQLPSVGCGNVLHDIINSNCIKVVRLTEIFRQARESAIIMNAHRINKGEPPVINDKDNDFFFMGRYSQEDVANTILQLVTDRLPKYKNLDNFKDIQILSPTRKSILGISSLNKMLQEKLNPPDISKKEKEFRDKIFRIGDKVMQLKNNYNITWKLMSKEGKRLDEGTGVFNGDEGIISFIDNFNDKLTVCFEENKYVDYDFSQLDELDLSYAVTIHKSQGSEYNVVIIPIHSGPPMLFTRNLLYTAVTRAKELCIIVGTEEMLLSMVANRRETLRYSSLDLKLIEISDIIKTQE